MQSKINQSLSERTMWTLNNTAEMEIAMSNRKQNSSVLREREKHRQRKENKLKETKPYGVNHTCSLMNTRKMEKEKRKGNPLPSKNRTNIKRGRRKLNDNRAFQNKL